MGFSRWDMEGGSQVLSASALNSAHSLKHQLQLTFHHQGIKSGEFPARCLFQRKPYMQSFRPALLPVNSRVQRGCVLLCSAKLGATLRFGCPGKSGGHSSAGLGARTYIWLCKQQTSLQVCPFLFFPFSNIINRYFFKFPAI